MYKNNDLGEKEDKENAATKISLWKLLKINNCEIYTISLWRLEPTLFNIIYRYDNLFGQNIRFIFFSIIYTKYKVKDFVLEILLTPPRNHPMEFHYKSKYCKICDKGISKITSSYNLTILSYILIEDNLN